MGDRADDLVRVCALSAGRVTLPVVVLVKDWQTPKAIYPWITIMLMTIWSFWDERMSDNDILLFNNPILNKVVSESHVNLLGNDRSSATPTLSGDTDKTQQTVHISYVVSKICA